MISVWEFGPGKGVTVRIRPSISFLVVILAWLAGPSQATPLNVGHRGYSAAFPENTLAALNGAFDVGADMVEIDLQKSQDGHVVLMHDETVDRTTDGTGLVSSRTLAQLQQLDAGSWFDPIFAGEPVPTLLEALQAGSGRGPLLLDQKSGLTFGAEITTAIATTAFPVEDLWVTAWEEAQVTDIRAQSALAGVRILWTETVVSGTDAEAYLDHCGERPSHEWAGALRCVRGLCLLIWSDRRRVSSSLTIHSTLFRVRR